MSTVFPDSFVPRLTHHLRNQLCGILGYADLLLMGLHGPLNEKQTRSVKMLVDGGNDLALLLENIRELIEHGEGKPTIVREPVHLAGAARAVLASYAAKAAAGGVTLEAAQIPEETLVWADEAALRRVLANLVANALRATPQGGTVALSWQRGPAGEDLVRVRDTGPGITSDAVRRLLASPLSEFAFPEPGSARGMGLGLVVCRLAAAAHGGRFSVEPAEGPGASLVLALPPQDR